MLNEWNRAIDFLFATVTVFMMILFTVFPTSMGKVISIHHDSYFLRNFIIFLGVYFILRSIKFLFAKIFGLVDLSEVPRNEKSKILVAMDNIFLPNNKDSAASYAFFSWTCFSVSFLHLHQNWSVALYEMLLAISFSLILILRNREFIRLLIRLDCKTFLIACMHMFIAFLKRILPYTLFPLTLGTAFYCKFLFE